MTTGRMTPVAVGAARPPGRPRSARADEAIIEAVLDLLAEGTPVDALSIEAVAARAGVGKATIYRRWANKDALLLDAIRALKGVPPQPAGASLRDDLVALVGSINRSQDRRALRVMPCLVPEVHRNPEHYRIFQEMIEQRRDVMRGVLRRGVESGELRADLDVELALTLLTAPMLVQKVLRWHPGLDEATLPEQVVDAVLRGITATSYR
ncbi:MAG TPA: TetR/AcrR family transcriptional regulator [Micromonosporaceae bacterium]|nr:TetR/AcrR family transcriptional regulator [Micromonosporaceae bacterium]